MNVAFDCSGKVVLVTGGLSGIGGATSLAFAPVPAWCSDATPFMTGTIMPVDGGFLTV